MKTLLFIMLIPMAIFGQREEMDYFTECYNSQQVVSNSNWSKGKKGDYVIGKDDIASILDDGTFIYVTAFEQSTYDKYYDFLSQYSDGMVVANEYGYHEVDFIYNHNIVAVIKSIDDEYVLFSIMITNL